MYTFFLYDRRNAVEESTKLGIGRSLVINKLDLDGLHRCDSKYGFAHSGAQTGQQFASGR